MGRLNKKYLLNSVFLITLIFSGCNKSKILGPAEYMEYLNSQNSGLTIVKDLNNISYKTKIQTTEQIALSMQKTYKGDKEFLNDLKDYNGLLNVIIIIKDGSKSYHEVKKAVYDQEKFGSFLGYANTELQKDIKLQLGTGKTISSSVVHMESANSIDPVVRIVASFTNVNLVETDCTIIFDDNLFNNGPIKFYYKKTVFENLPQLKFNI